MFIGIYVQQISGERLQDHWSSGFQEGQCAALTSFRVGKMSFLWKKGMFFTILLKRCEKGWTEASLADMFWAEMTKMSKT